MSKKIYYSVFSIAFFFSLFFSSCGKYDGSEITMYYPDSIPKLKAYYKYVGNKKEIVKEERFYPNRNIMSVGEFDDNFKKNGTWKYFFDDGKLQRIENYKNGIKDGKYVEYYRSGKKMFEGEYKNGLPDGKWIIYNEKGKKVSINKYLNGKILKK